MAVSQVTHLKLGLQPQIYMGAADAEDAAVLLSIS